MNRLENILNNFRLLAALLAPLFCSSLAMGAVHFKAEEIVPTSISPRNNQVIPVTLITAEMLQPLELDKATRKKLKTALMHRENYIRAKQASTPKQRLKDLLQKRDAARDAVLPELYSLDLTGSSTIARILLEWDQASVIYEEDVAYYKTALKRFKSCKADCREPVKPFPEYGDLVAGLEDSMPSDDEPRMQVYNLYLRGIFYESLKDEVGAVSAYGEATQIGNARLIPEIHMRIGDLETAIGNYEAAAHQYESVSFGEYYADSRVKQAWAYRQVRDCKNVLKVAARFRHTVTAQADQKRLSPEMLRYETECAAFYLRMDEVVKYDPAGVSLIEREIKSLKQARNRRGARHVVKQDFGICLADALQNQFEVTELGLNLAGTTRDPVLTWVGAVEGVESDVPEPEEVYAANIAACMARRLELLSSVTKLSGSVRLIVP